MNDDRREQIKNQIYADIEYCIEELEGELLKGTPEAFLCIAKMFEIPYIRELSGRDNTLNIARQISEIWKCECKEYGNSAIYSHIGSIADMEEVYYRILFYLQRIWFQVPEEYIAELRDRLLEHSVSGIAVRTVLRESRIKPKEAIEARLREEGLL